MTLDPMDLFNVMDIECYPNYFLVQFLNQDGEYNSFELTEDKPLDYEALEEFINSAPMITFNGNNYDLPMLAYAMKGADNEMLKSASDNIILNNVKPWAFYRSHKIQQPSWNHIDIQEVTPGVMVSLKAYGGRIHMPKMQDLPYDPDCSLSVEQMGDVKEYCKNDLQTTLAVFRQIQERVQLRRLMSYEYHTDLRSKSDAQVAEAVIKAELQRMTGKVIGKVSVRDQEFFYKKPDYINFKTPQLQALLEMILRSPFLATAKGQIEMTKELSDTTISIGQSTYQLGIGGLHSQESEQAIVADDTFDLYDNDFTSYYPFIILNNNLYPQKLGEGFLTVYRNLVERRLEAKRSGDKAVTESLKITINGTFGKLGSIYSPIYAPDLMIQVTVTGQLTLLMLIERLELAGMSVVSANTDGIVIKCPKDKRQDMLGIIDEFQKLTNHNLEEAQYKALYSRDVNNYIAIGVDGKVKTKGTFSSAGLQKTPANDICNTALIAYLKDGTPFEDTIKACKDITQFVNVRAVKGGGMYGNMYLGKTVRWYYSKDSNHIISYRGSGNKVPRTDGSYPAMNLPEKFPEDMDYDWYIRESIKMLKDIGVKDAYTK